MEKKQNVKAIVGLSAFFCLLLFVQSYFRPWRTMDLILFMGQSNMSGAYGEASEAPELIQGAGYEYRAITDPKRLHVLEEPFGENEHREGALDDRGILRRQGSLVTAFVNAYYEETGTPVVGISSCRGSSSMNTWLNRGLKEDAGGRLAQAREVLEKKRIQVRHTYMVWYQGETDVSKKEPKEDYKYNMGVLMDYMEEQGVEKCFLIQIEQADRNNQNYEVIRQAQAELCEERDDMILASSLPNELVKPENMDKGGLHFNQNALNQIGEDAGRTTGRYVALETKKETE